MRGMARQTADIDVLPHPGKGNDKTNIFKLPPLCRDTCMMKNCDTMWQTANMLFCTSGETGNSDKQHLQLNGDAQWHVSHTPVSGPGTNGNRDAK